MAETPVRSTAGLFQPGISRWTDAQPLCALQPDVEVWFPVKPELRDVRHKTAHIRLAYSRLFSVDNDLGMQAGGMVCYEPKRVLALLFRCFILEGTSDSATAQWTCGDQRETWNVAGKATAEAVDAWSILNTGLVTSKTVRKVR